MSKSTRDGFESVKDQIGSCGIWTAKLRPTWPSLILFTDED